MVICKDCVTCKNELNLLMAVKYEVDLCDFGMTVQEAKATFLFRSHLEGVSEKFSTVHQQASEVIINKSILVLIRHSVYLYKSSYYFTWIG